MPILEAEPAQYPHTLFAASMLPNSDSNWSVLHCKPRQEKSLARQLYEKQVSFYLPQVNRRLRIRGRAVVSCLPLFPGYLFLRSTAEERLSALTVRAVVRSLEVANQEQLWHDLRQIKQLIDSGLPMAPEDRLLAGTLVEIRSGPLVGLRGKIVRLESRHRFLVQVNFIQQGASVLLDGDTLVAAEDTGTTAWAAIS